MEVPVAEDVPQAFTHLPPLTLDVTGGNNLDAGRWLARKFNLPSLANLNMRDYPEMYRMISSELRIHPYWLRSRSIRQPRMATLECGPMDMNQKLCGLPVVSMNLALQVTDKEHAVLLHWPENQRLVPAFNQMVAEAMAGELMSRVVNGILAERGWGDPNYSWKVYDSFLLRVREEETRLLTGDIAGTNFTILTNERRGKACVHPVSVGLMPDFQAE